MPSGAKKRKAAKRRKKQAARQNIISTKSNLGNADPRIQEERESDGSVSSHASRDNEDNHPLKTNMEPVTEASRFSEEDSIKIEKGLKPEEKIEIADSGPEQDKSSSSSSSSSSEDESLEIENRDNKEAGFLAAEVIASSLSKQAVSTSANAPIATVIVETTAPRVSLMPAERSSEEQIQTECVSKKASLVSAVDDEKSLPDVNQNVAKDVSASDEIREASSSAMDPIPETNGVAEGFKESEVPISHEIERPPLGIAKRTSWLSCCGLFDVITGSRT